MGDYAAFQTPDGAGIKCLVCTSALTVPRGQFSDMVDAMNAFLVQHRACDGIARSPGVFPISS